MANEINWLEKIQETSDFIKRRVNNHLPNSAIILGSGLGALVNNIKVEVEIPYNEVPNFPVSTVEGHKGCLIFGTLGKKYVEVTFPIRVMHAIGIKTVFVSNASGGMNPNFKVGDLMLITDHINLFPEHPLHGKNINELGPRFPAMGEAYSKRLIQMARDIAAEKNVRLMEGVYVGTQGPTFETPSEYRYFWRIGGDAVGMSTVPEVIVARHGDMEVFGISVITDLGIEGVVERVSHEEVQKAAAAAQPIMAMLVEEIINRVEDL